MRWSFPQLVAKIGDAARAMIASGVQPGDRVAIWAPNSWEWLLTALGCQSVGGVVTPLNTRFKGNEAGDAIEIVQATRLFTVTDFLGTNYVDLLAGAPGAESIGETVVLRGTVPPGCVAFAEFLARADGVSQHEADAARGGGAARRPVRRPLHVGHDRAPQGRHAVPLGEHPRVRPRGATSWVSAPATAISSSARSSTRSA